MMSWAAAVVLEPRATVGLEKWQLTPAGKEAQPRPMVSENPSTEVKPTLTVAFCVVAIVTLAGRTVTAKLVTVPAMETAGEVDGECKGSPL